MDILCCLQEVQEGNLVFGKGGLRLEEHMIREFEQILDYLFGLQDEDSSDLGLDCKEQDSNMVCTGKWLGMGRAGVQGSQALR